MSYDKEDLNRWHELACKATHQKAMEFVEWQVGIWYSQFEMFRDTNYEMPDHFITENITQLLDHYRSQGRLTKKAKKNLLKQLNSPDRENWLLAFGIIKAISEQ